MNDIKTCFPKGYVSHSQLTSFQRCPHYFKLKYIDGKDGPNNFYAIFGSIMHEVLEMDAISQKEFKKHLSKRELCDHYDRLWASSEDVYPDKSTRKEYRERGYDIIDWILRQPIEHVIEVESEFLIESPILSVPVKGIIDLVVQTKDGLVIADYKTGKPFTQRDTDNSLQASIYGAAVMKIHDNIPVRYEFRFVYVDKVNTTTRTKAQLIKAIIDVECIIQDILHSDFKEKCSEGKDWFCNNLCELRKSGDCIV